MTVATPDGNIEIVDGTAAEYRNIILIGSKFRGWATAINFNFSTIAFLQAKQSEIVEW